MRPTENHIDRLGVAFGEHRASHSNASQLLLNISICFFENMLIYKWPGEIPRGKEG